jgi:hypothetical protein
MGYFVALARHRSEELYMEVDWSLDSGNSRILLWIVRLSYRFGVSGLSLSYSGSLRSP